MLEWYRERQSLKHRATHQAAIFKKLGVRRCWLYSARNWLISKRKNRWKYVIDKSGRKLGEGDEKLVIWENWEGWQI